jgi:hypothetical protein
LSDDVTREHPGADFIVSYFGTYSTMPIYLSSLPNAEDKDTEPGERHIITRNSEQIAAFVGKWDRPKRGIYFAVSPIARTATRRAKENVAELVGLHADIDFKSTAETPEEIERILGQLQMLPTNWDREERDIRDMCVDWTKKHPEIQAKEPGGKSQAASWWHGDIDISASRKFLVKNLIPETGNGLLPGQWGTHVA